jgi:hypothetical protein
MRAGSDGSVRSRTVAANTRTRDLPTASSLDKAREVVTAVADGHDASLLEAGRAAGLSDRHAGYYGLAVTDTLGLVAVGAERLRVTKLGRELLSTVPGSDVERRVWAKAIAESVSVTSVAPDLLDDRGPTLVALTQRIVHAGLSASTARRRASALLSWRRVALAQPERTGG